MRTKASLLAQGRLRSVTRLMFTLFFAQSANAELYQWAVAGAECNTVTGVRQEPRDACPSARS
ncbi:hypothetical protein IPC1510_09150 [Pseudomonas aeruginosa]|nr:hypothetical protein IPC1510_09150 [Pseudomonas aeruginosa]